MKEVFKILSKIRDLIFPVFCIFCGAEGQVVCAGCLEKIKARPQIFYPADSFLDKAIALGNYQDKMLQKAIVEYKYNFRQEIFIVFQRIVDDWQTDEKNFWSDGTERQWVIVPVPLHSSRLWERGFNQAEEIAKAVGWKLNLEIAGRALKRIKKTKRQVGLGKEERKMNLAGAFAAQEDLRGKNVILVDDVYTTGATLGECAMVCKEAGAGLVWALTLAREG